MRFGSVCSGIEAASVAWHPLGWRAAWLAEIEPFPSAVLAHHYPDVPNYGDMSQLPERIVMGEIEAPDVFCGGTPCQAFSVAGLRKSLDDARGNLSLTFCEIANAIDLSRAHDGQQPCIVFWENVPGVLNTKDNAFGCFLAGLAGEDGALVPAGDKWPNAGAVFGPQRAVAWRVLDAQYFGVAQRRRRVFVVASARDDFDPVSVLFEFEGVRRDSAPSRKTGEATPSPTGASLDVSCIGTLTAGFGKVGAPEVDAYTCLPAVRHCAEITSALCAADGPKGVSDQYAHEGEIIAMAHGQANAEIKTDGSAPTLTCVHEAPIAAYGIPGNWIGRKPENGGNAVEPMHDVAPCLTKADQHGVAFQSSQSGVRLGDTHATLDANNGPRRHNGALVAMQVRRLTPRECERLQGFPDDYTLVPNRGKPAADGPRYKSLGNSWAVPNVRWIGWRIAAQVFGDLA